MSFFSKLFGGGRGASPPPASPAAGEDYKGFVIRAAPRQEQGQFLLAGSIEKTVDGVEKRHDFVRADRSPDRDEIAEMALAKARLMIDQQGDGLFS